MLKHTNKSLYSSEDTKKFLRDRVARPGGSAVIGLDASDRVLLVKAYYKKYWSFPGGWIESDQTPLDAAVLEFKEEVGLEIDRESLSLVFMLNRRSEIMQSYQFVFKTPTIITEDMISRINIQEDEITDYRMVSREEIMSDLDNYSVTVGLWAEGGSKSYYELEVPA